MNSMITNLYLTQNITLITLIHVPSDILSKEKIFSALATNNINIDMVSQTSPLKDTINISFTIQDDELFNAIQALKSFKNTMPELRIEVNSNNTKISLYGDEMRSTPGVFAETLKVLVEAQVDVKMITTSEVDISYLVYSTDELKATQAIKTHYKL